MSASNSSCGCGCGGSGGCDSALPDNPQCAPNYHFGMLLGVEDFRAEQGFHVGRQRRHQRALHGSGVVAGFAVQTHGERGDELRVSPGLAIDRLGRDLALEMAQCLSLPAWWAAQQALPDFALRWGDVDPRNAWLTLALRATYATCLDRPVPALADPCAGDGSDIAYARVCETVRLSLAPATEPAPATPSHHLLRMWLTLDEPRLDEDGQPLPDDAWLIAAYAQVQTLARDEQPAARAALLREVLARSVAAEDSAAPKPPDSAVADPDWAALPLALLRDVHLWQDADGAHASVGAIELGLRDSLLPTAALQALLLAEPPAMPVSAGPALARQGPTLIGQDLQLVFTQALAPASLDGAFQVSEFDPTTGWQAFTLAAPLYDEAAPAGPTVTLGLDRLPTGALLRATVIGSGPQPLLGATLIPAGALGPDGQGRDLSTTITL
ncbi:hypothetical protein KAK06_00830 [Ideonella sp. 4Y11]|uniref:Uncharacterized protein n=1 Tax=Ideonella aquatica TaxID=2824119 RepID=A0A940YDY0_9BURK|nr:hypothetical protein [Ideonella aquatica]MBQ0957489.1 hypothetical protein [Ideonella aquatica]